MLIWNILRQYNWIRVWVPLKTFEHSWNVPFLYFWWIIKIRDGPQKHAFKKIINGVSAIINYCKIFELFSVQFLLHNIILVQGHSNHCSAYNNYSNEYPCCVHCNSHLEQNKAGSLVAIWAVLVGYENIEKKVRLVLTHSYFGYKNFLVLLFFVVFSFLFSTFFSTF